MSLKLLAVFLVSILIPLACRAAPPPGRSAVLRQGINITGWFRHPPGRDPAMLRAWLSDAAMADLKSAGFTFVRLAFDPAFLDGPGPRQVFLDQIRRLQKHGLAVIVSPHPVGWAIDTNLADRARFTAFWHGFAPSLRGLPPALTFPEILNEPVFHADPPAWWALQRDTLLAIRAALPAHTVVVTGHDGGSIAGLLALPPVPDGNVVHSFHFYDPPELTALAAYRPGLDRAALARLPFPATDPAACQAAAMTTGDAPTRGLIAFYCATPWDAPRIRARLLDAATWARQHGAVLLAGEFGATTALNPAARLAWLSLVRETCAVHGIHWALWGYDDVMGLAVPRPPVHRPVLDRSVLEALGLSRP